MHTTLWLAVLAIVAQPEEKTGTLVGQVRFLGTVPPAKKILTTDGATILHHDLVVDARSKGLKNVVAHLDGLPDDAKPLGTGRVVMDQLDMIFVPRVVAIREGQTVRFDNNDLCNHGVRALSTQAKNTFNILTPPSQPFDFVFQAQKNPIVLDCPLHAWMKAWIFPFRHPWFAVSDGKGAFRIENIPAGKHTLILRHPDTGTRMVRTVEVGAGETVRVSVEWKTGDGSP